MSTHRCGSIAIERPKRYHNGTRNVLIFTTPPSLLTTPHPSYISPSPKLHTPNTASIPDPMQLQLLKLLTAGMEINPTNTPHPLIETDIIEPLKARATNTLHPMIRHKKQLLPPHEQMVLLQMIVKREATVEVGGGRGLGGGGQDFCIVGPESGEARPVLQVYLGRAVQGRVGGEEEVIRADQFGVEEGC